ncbi:alpha/beta hydrolase [Rhodovulum sp. MB263]|uniref:alpha/beta hydrolase n=1 Tax=Rhodovulum sp. (strain MB263) TaxID=308754 RepID=UPI0009B7BA9F|nr:alpha/beta fold hydrolase [Rhodovulum sp. MB263]ARC89364.1 alpha/beta hydrolase [Rhodovulum sp. MB263]
MRLFALLSLFCPAVALAGPVQIEGPAGPLEAEALAVAGARAAVVIVPGSGPVDRDGNAPALGLRSDSYRLLAEALQAAGVASLRIDKRGFGGSAGAIADPNDVTIAAYAGDLRRWVARAAGLAPCVWIAGHSEGGLVALVAAGEPPEALCGLILMATPGRPVGQLMVEQMRALPGNAPLMPEIEAMVATLEAGGRRDPETLPPPLRQLFAAGLQDYMADLFVYDPAALAEGWHGPALILQGGADMQVRPEDADRLAAAMPQARRVDLPGVTHMLKADLPGRPYVTYTEPTLPLAPGVVAAILEAVEGTAEGR